MISGSGGMLASALIDRLLMEKSIEKVYALSSNPANVLASHKKNSRLVALSFDEAIAALDVEDVDLLIHAAFPRQNDAQSIATGLAYTRGLLVHVPPSCAIIHISSQSVYDPTRTAPATEESGPVYPSSPYAVAKLDSEQLIFDLCPGSKVSNIRLASLISPEFEDRFVNKLIRGALQTGEVLVFGPNNQFGFLDIFDAANAITAMVVQVNTKDWHAVYNVGPHQKSYSLEEISAEVKKVIAKYGRPCRLNVSLEDRVSSSSLDSTRFEQDFSWQSQKTLEETLSRIVEYQLALGKA